MSNDMSKGVSTASTQDHLAISDVKDSIVMLKNGGACMIIRTTAVNFGLLSENEQDAIIYAYAGFLNSLSFSIQILILSKKMDITSYLALIKSQAQKQTNQALKNQIFKYQQFIASIIQENKVLDKAFYIVVPFSPLELGVKGGTTQIIPTKKARKLNYSQDQLFEKAKNALTPRQDNIIRLLTRMGLKAEPLSTPELIRLFYSIYNPEQAIGQKMVSTADYQSALVQPVVDLPIPSAENVLHHQQSANFPLPTPRPAIHQALPVQQTVPPQQVSTMPAMQQSMPKPGATSSKPASVSVADVQSVLARLQTEVTKMQRGKK